jgi:hypothetical protein
MSTTLPTGTKIIQGATTDEVDGTAPQPHANIAAGLSLHAESIEPLRELLVNGGVDEHARVAFLAARGALEHAVESVTAMTAARTECASHDPKTKHVGSDGTVTLGVDPALVTDLITAVNASYTGGARKIDTAMKAIDQANDSLTTKINAAVIDQRRNEPSRVQLAAEIRQYVRNLPDVDRPGWLMERCREGDAEVIFSVLGGSAYVSGLPVKLHAALRTYAEQKWAPKESAARDGLAKLREQMVDAGQKYYEKYASTVPTQSPARARSTEALARLRKVA